MSARHKAPPRPEPWLPFTEHGFVTRDGGKTYERVPEGFRFFRNNRYAVMLDECDGVVHLHIRADDRSHLRDWRDYQRIKNELVGPECEGLELYPAESRLVDGANSFHLWVHRDPSFRIPVGWFDGR